MKWPIDHTPNCFTEKEWQEWTRIWEGAQTPCVDCSAAHQAKMIAQGRCERPAVLFWATKGEVIGIGPDECGYLSALRATPYSPEVAARIMATSPGRTLRREIESWIAKGTSHG